MVFAGNKAIVGSAIYANGLNLCSWLSYSPPYFGDAHQVLRWPIITYRCVSFYSYVYILFLHVTQCEKTGRVYVHKIHTFIIIMSLNYVAISLSIIFTYVLFKFCKLYKIARSCVHRFTSGVNFIRTHG